jgi:hypothetical protein
MNRSRSAFVLLAAVIAAIAVTACGAKKAKVVVVTVTAPATHAATTPHTTATTAPATTKSTAATPPPATTTTGTPTAPASAQTPKGDLAAATASVRSRGYTPAVTYTYHPDSTLGVILGTKASGEEQAFFFVRGRYIGTDTKDPSAGISVVGQDDTSVTLRYALYAPNDPLTSPTGSANVTYTLDNGKLEPQGPIPSSSTTAAQSRR